MSELRVSLDVPVPVEVAVGTGTAVFVAGTCFSSEGHIRALELLVDGAPQPVMAAGMPRLDYFRSLHPNLDPFAADRAFEDPGSDEDPHLHSYASGFWGIARIEPGHGPADRRLALRARLEGGGEAVAELARVRCAELARPDATLRAAPEIAICMATYDPPPDLFERQVESIRAQSHTDWLCFVSDDASSEDSFARIQRVVGDDPRFVLSRAPARQGFYRNFEHALAMAPPGARLVAMADQDDVWHPDKLATLREELGASQLVYSDARVVARDGKVISESYWSTRRNNHSDLLSLLVANAVTGAASLMRREVLDHALPFPPDQFAHFHDHWIGLVALALGDIGFVDRPLYDYVQHGQASLGHAAATRMPRLAHRLAHQRAPRERVRSWRLHYFVDGCRLLVLATILRMRCGGRMSAPKRRALERFLAADTSAGSLVRLALRGARELLGRSGTLGARPQTLGAEWMLFWAFAWRRLLATSARRLPQRRLRLDAVPPPWLALAPGHTSLGAAVDDVVEKIKPLELAPGDGHPERVNVLIPSFDVEHFFGGYIAKLNLARRLAESGVRVRIVTVDPEGALPSGWKRRVESYSGLRGVFDEVEVAFGRGGAPLEVSRSDRFVATTWWTAHIAAAAGRALGADRFVYLIQEYEPFTFPMGTYAALAAESYRFAHFALFSSELLRGYFRGHRLGVFADGEAAGDAASAAFENAITPVPAPSAAELAHRAPRRLLFYARPEAHAARNMFELGVIALSRAAREGAFAGGWELHGVGARGPKASIDLGGGALLELRGRVDQHAYADLLREHDVGVALMCTPHPSLVPIEMASAGMLTVTNTFENKTAGALAAISSNLIAAPPTVGDLSRAIADAVAGAGDAERRIAGSAVAWSRNWEQSFDDRLIARVLDALGRPVAVSARAPLARARESA